MERTIRWSAIGILVATIAHAPARAQGDDTAHAPARAQGDDTARFRAKARLLAPITATNDLDATASGSTLKLRDRSRALEELGEALVETPGTRVQESGGLGGFSGVSLRGAELGHTAVLLGTIPLHTPDTGAFDFSLIPLAALDRVEVYRGGAPAWLSEGSIGGVVRLVPAHAEETLLRATLGMGSFGRREVRATSLVSREGGRRPSLFTHVDLARADNDYAYLDDGQTRFDASDDRWVRQRNADVHAGNGLVHAGVDALGGRLEAVAMGHGRTEGVPGPLAVPSRRTRRQLVRTLGAVSWERERLAANGERHHRVQLVASANQQTQRFTDLHRELGRTRASLTDDLWWRVFTRAAGSLRSLPFLEASVVGSLTFDGLRPDDRLAFTMPPSPSRRRTQALTLETRIHGRLGGWRAELRPSVRLQWSQTAIDTWGSLGSRLQDERVDFAPTYRLVLSRPLPGRELLLSLTFQERAP